jgi:hypothetical protein
MKVRGDEAGKEEANDVMFPLVPSVHQRGCDWHRAVHGGASLEERGEEERGEAHWRAEVASKGRSWQSMEAKMEQARARLTLATCRAGPALEERSFSA